MFNESNPKEARKMVSNLSETLKKAYDDSFLMGEVKGIEQGAEQAKRDIILNMPSKNMAEKLNSDIIGLSIDRFKAIKKNDLVKIH